MDSFVIYPGWRLLGADLFVKFHQQQSIWIINAFVIPLAIATILNILLLWQRPDFINKKMILLSLCCMIVNWVMSFFIQIPIHHQLNQTYNAVLLEKLITTNYLRVVLQKVQLLVVFQMLLSSIYRNTEKNCNIPIIS